MRRVVGDLTLRRYPSPGPFPTRWQALRLGLVLRQVNQDDVGPVWLAAAHAADGLQLMLNVCGIANRVVPNRISVAISVTTTDTRCCKVPDGREMTSTTPSMNMVMLIRTVIRIATPIPTSIWPWERTAAL